MDGETSVHAMPPLKVALQTSFKKFRCGSKAFAPGRTQGLAHIGWRKRLEILQPRDDQQANGIAPRFIVEKRSTFARLMEVVAKSRRQPRRELRIPEKANPHRLGIRTIG